MTTVAIVQARMASVRFPDKVMQRVCGTPIIGLLLDRLARAKRLDRIVVATSCDPRDQPLLEYVRSLGYETHAGSEDDVLDRYFHAARAAAADNVVRVTGDCPLVDPELLDQLIDMQLASGADYASNSDPATFPDGLDIEVFRFAALERAWQQARTPAEREHVTLFMRAAANGFATASLRHDIDLSAERWTVDEPEDLEVVARVFEHFAPRRDFSWTEVLKLSKEHPEYFAANRHLPANEGAELGTGQKLWKRAKRVIPGGNMLLSKRAEMFLPDRWPAYFQRAQGCRVWDLDGREYIDMSMMGIGTNVLGYGHPEVDAAVQRTVTDGNLSTLNCPEEVYLAERLVELHPWADMARFARSGGEANAIAIRIARAASRRDKVAICGYHGWHDWYLAANLAEEQALDGHLLPGLTPNGVPRDLRGTVLPFRYNQLDELETLLAQHPDLGVIKMEVSRGEPPVAGFLESVRRLASQRDIVLIFDECSSGFRETLGGLHLKYGVEPDIAVFGKALGNGYAITAVVGRRHIMNAAQTSFISSTFWTERIGPTAAMATLAVMERTKSWVSITETGSAIMAGWHAAADKHSLNMTISGLPALAGFTIESPHALAYKTLITQEMLAKGYLAGTSVYASIAHEPQIVAGYFEAIDPIFALIRECEDGREVASLLRGPVCHSGFRRLT